MNGERKIKKRTVPYEFLYEDSCGVCDGQEEKEVEYKRIAEVNEPECGDLPFWG